MIFSEKLYKIEDGINVSLYENNNELFLSIFNNCLKFYKISLNNNKKCVFLKNFNFQKYIIFNQEFICTCYNGIMQINTNEQNT